MIISCQRCGAILATRSDTHIKVKGQEVPTDRLDGVILRCDACKRTKTFYLKSAQKPVNTAQNDNAQDMVVV